MYCVAQNRSITRFSVGGIGDRPQLNSTFSVGSGFSLLASPFKPAAETIPAVLPSGELNSSRSASRAALFRHRLELLRLEQFRPLGLKQSDKLAPVRNRQQLLQL
jgi:hypothetical protein